MRALPLARRSHTCGCLHPPIKVRLRDADHSSVAEILFVLGVVALALVVVPLMLAVGGRALWTLLLDDAPESYLSDRGARRSLLRG